MLEIKALKCCWAPSLVLCFGLELSPTKSYFKCLVPILWCCFERSLSSLTFPFTDSCWPRNEEKPLNWTPAALRIYWNTSAQAIINWPSWNQETQEILPLLRVAWDMATVSLFPGKHPGEIPNKVVEKHMAVQCSLPGVKGSSLGFCNETLRRRT